MSEYEGPVRLPGIVTVETWHPAYRRARVPLAEVPRVFAEAPDEASLGMTLDDGADDCVIVMVGRDFSTVTLLRDRTFYGLRISPDEEAVVVLIAGVETTWSRGCLLPRSWGAEVLAGAADREALWAAHTWAEQ